MEATGVDHPTDLAGGPEELDRSKLGQSQVRRITETDRLARGRTAWCRAVAQAKARRHLALRLEAGKPDGRAAALAASRRGEVFECPSCVDTGALEDVVG